MDNGDDNGVQKGGPDVVITGIVNDLGGMVMVMSTLLVDNVKWHATVHLARIVMVANFGAFRGFFLP